MSLRDSFDRSVTRRQFLETTAAAAILTGLPFRRSEGTLPPTPYHRLNITDPGAAAMLAAYKVGITKMLALPPSDPRNWYRHAFVHTLDCPHGNWWLLPWHRGYIGWFEQTIRDLSGVASFALPYWDWTANPAVPSTFLTGVLNPSNPAYIASLTTFQAQLTTPMSAFWKSLTAAQKAQLKKRGFNSMSDVWSGVTGDPMFFPSAQARTHTGAFDTPTKAAVAQSTITAALAATDFVTFGSDVAAYHSQGVGSGILEGQPHNLVHNFIGGFMQDFLSPVDPLFYMHHSNIDRLWTVWTAKQVKAGLPTLPTGANLAPWQNESFLFYINAAGKPVTQNTAGAYATIGAFNYDYPASQLLAGPPHGKKTLVKATLRDPTLCVACSAKAQVAIDAPTVQAASKEAGPELFARVTIQPPADTRNVKFDVFVNPPSDAAKLTADHPSFAGTIAFFGNSHHGAPMTFTVPISGAVRKLSTANLLNAASPLQIHVVPRTSGVSATAALSASSLQAVSVGTF